MFLHIWYAEQNMQKYTKYAKYAHIYAQICTNISYMQNMQKYTKYAKHVKYAQICINIPNMQNMQNHTGRPCAPATFLGTLHAYFFV